jgi:hypothetical protein
MDREVWDGGQFPTSILSSPEDGGARQVIAEGKYRFQPRPAAKKLDKKVT